MRATTLLAQLLGQKGMRVTGFEFTSDSLLVDVTPRGKRAVCSGCDRRQRSIYDRRERTWRDLDLGGVEVQLRYAIRRVSCPRCGVVTERVPWAEASTGFTYAFEDRAAYLVQRTDRTTVSRLMRVAWRTVGRIVERVVARIGSRNPLRNLTYIGVDEISYRRHHEYITVVVDHVLGRVVWAKRGKNAETFKSFFEDLGPEGVARLRVVTMDMSAAFVKAVREAAPGVEVVFDRFHVQRLAHDALDEVRREQWREQRGTEAGKALKHMRWPLQKNPWNLTQREADRLSTLAASNQRLYRAYLLKESLAGVLDGRQVGVARTKLKEWIAWASRSKLPPFVKLSRTIRDHLEGILAYVRTGLSNGATEGLNGKIRVLTRRAYGFHSADSLIALLRLCCGGLELLPVFTYPKTNP